MLQCAVMKGNTTDKNAPALSQLKEYGTSTEANMSSHEWTSHKAQCPTAGDQSYLFLPSLLPAPISCYPLSGLGRLEFHMHQERCWGVRTVHLCL